VSPHHNAVLGNNVSMAIVLNKSLIFWCRAHKVVQAFAKTWHKDIPNTDCVRRLDLVSFVELTKRSLLVFINSFTR